MRRGITAGAYLAGLTAIAVAACSGGPSPAPSVTSVGQTHSPGPAAGSSRMAHALAVRMLGQFALPAGTRRVSLHPVPTSLTPPLWATSANTADVHHVYRLPMPMGATYRYVLAHRPAGYGSLGTGTGSGPAGVTSMSVSYQLTSAPSWVRSAQISTAIVPDPAGGSLLRVDAQVLWFPPRSAAEYVSPMAYRQVRVSASFMNPKPILFSRVIKDRAEIARLAILLDSLHAAAQEVMNCPAIDATYRLTFLDPTARQPVITASMTVCLTVLVTVGGKAQPALWNSAPLIARIRHLLAVPSHYR